MSFIQAPKVGAITALIAALIYTFTRIVVSELNPGLHESIANMYIKDIESKWLTGVELQAALTELEQSMADYKKPILKFGITLMEILLLGLIASLISSIILRTKNN